MTIKIYSEKLLIYNKKYRKITGFELFGKKDLPQHYLNGYPRCTLDNCKLVIYIQQGESIVSNGDIFCEEAYQSVYDMLEMCGNRLHEINEMASWEGKCVDEI